MSESVMKKNYKFVIQHKKDLLQHYCNKYILVFNTEFVNSFDTYHVAAAEGIRRFGLNGDFLVYFLSQIKPVNFIYCRA